MRLLTIVATALSLAVTPVAALELILCYDADMRGGCANKLPMPTNSCFSNRGGTNWSGFSNDAVSSYRVTGGCCNFYKDKDCQGQPVRTDCNTQINNLGGFNDQLSSVFCY